MNQKELIKYQCMKYQKITSICETSVGGVTDGNRLFKCKY